MFRIVLHCIFLTYALGTVIFLLTSQNQQLEPLPVENREHRCERTPLRLR